MVVGMLLSVATFFVAITGVNCYPNGAPTGRCITMMPGHNVPAQSTTAPYRITVNASSYMPGDVIEVTVSGNMTSDTMQGFLIQARRVNCGTASTEPIGTFSLKENTNLKTINCGNGNANAITHSQRFGNAQNKMFTWKAPPSDEGNVYFRGTIVRVRIEFWMGVRSSAITSPSGICPTTPSTTTMNPSMTTRCVTCSATSLATSAFILTSLTVIVRFAMLVL